MPITAKLSRRFYDQFGDDIVDELVELLNQVDLTYRSELREQNEINFARFDAKLEQRVAEVRGEIVALRAEVMARMEALDTKLSTRLDATDTKLSTRLDATDTKLSARLDAADTKFATKSDLQALKAELIKWMFLFWAGTALAGLLLR